MLIADPDVPFVAGEIVVGGRSGIGLLPGITDAGIDSVGGVDVVGHAGGQFRRFPGGAEGIAVAEVEDVPGPLLGDLPIARDVQGVVGNIRVGVVVLDDARIVPGVAEPEAGGQAEGIRDLDFVAEACFGVVLRLSAGLEGRLDKDPADEVVVEIVRNAELEIGVGKRPGGVAAIVDGVEFRVPLDCDRPGWRCRTA